MHGHYELSRKNYVGAITDFNEYLAQNPDSLDVRNRVGYCHMKAEQPDKAISSFRQVLTQDKDNTYAILQLGLAWLQKGDPEQTIAIWQLYPNNTQQILTKEIKRQFAMLEILTGRMAPDENNPEAMLFDSETINRYMSYSNQQLFAAIELELTTAAERQKVYNADHTDIGHDTNSGGSGDGGCGG